MLWISAGRIEARDLTEGGRVRYKRWRITHLPGLSDLSMNPLSRRRFTLLALGAPVALLGTQGASANLILSLIHI